MAEKKNAKAKSAEKQQAKQPKPHAPEKSASPCKKSLAAIKTKKLPKAEQGAEGGNGATPDPPADYVIEARRKLHREIFDKCVEKKMMQDMDFWEP